MKRALIAMLIAMLLAVPAMAEIETYADQGGVMVFSEDGKVGLMDGEGNILLPAEYDEIDPFRGNYAEIMADGLLGVVRRDGSVAVPCEWDWISVYPERDMAVGTADGANRVRKLYDLNTGEVLMDGGGKKRFHMDDRYIYVLEYGYDDPFELMGPFRMTLCDGDLDPIVTLDDAGEVTPIDWGFVVSTEAVPWNPGTDGVTDLEGRVLLKGLSDWELSGEDICYERYVYNPVRKLLEALGYDRKRVKNGLRWVLGVDADIAHLMTMFMEDYRICGILRKDGSRTEVLGWEIYPKDDAGLYCVNARCVDKYDREGTITPRGGEPSEALYDRLAGKLDRWGYMDDLGRWVIPPVYDEAFPFVDGTAVVREGEEYHLIDETGAALPLRWGWPCYGKLPVIVGCVDGGLRLIDRRGGFLTDEVFAREDFIPEHTSIMGPWSVYADSVLLLRDARGRMCAMDTRGQELCRFDAENWESGIEVEGGAALWARRDGLWGLVALKGPHAGEWRVEPVYRSVYEKGEGVYSLMRADYTWVLMDAKGDIIGPGWVDPETVEMYKQIDATVAAQEAYE